MITTIIYALMDKHGIVRYVGKTEGSMPSRMAMHMLASRKPKGPPSSRWIASLGYRPCHLILETIGQRWAGRRERWWIAHLRDLGFNLVNVREGGESVPRRPRGQPAPTREQRLALKREAQEFWETFEKEHPE